MAQPAKKTPDVAPTATPPAVGEAKTVLWDLTPKQLAVFGVLVLAANLPLIHYFLLRPHPPVTVQVPFRDDFDRADVGPHYHSIGGQPRIVNGWLEMPGVKNNPLWLDASLPQNVRVEFDARATSPEGDIKVEIFGNGWDHASGYVLIFGGWSNSVSVLARLDEHGEALPSLKARASRGEASIGARTAYRVERHDPKVEAGRAYHFRIERIGGRIAWYIDNELFIDLDDQYPLTGAWHDRFGFSGWDSIVYFDNLSITPL